MESPSSLAWGHRTDVLLGKHTSGRRRRKPDEGAMYISPCQHHDEEKEHPENPSLGDKLAEEVGR
jgi:hypothetical protein